MKALVVYESMFGNTRRVAQEIAAGLGTRFAVSVVPVSEATPDLVEDVDLIVVGGPTHVHGMASARTRSGSQGDGGQGGQRARARTRCTRGGIA